MLDDKGNIISLENIEMNLERQALDADPDPLRCRSDRILIQIYNSDSKATNRNRPCSALQILILAVFFIRIHRF